MGNRVRQARLEARITQQELGKLVGVTRQTINQIEGGGYNPTLKLCLALSYALARTLNDLFWIEPKGDGDGPVQEDL